MGNDEGIDVIIMVDGKPIGEVKSISMERDVEPIEFGSSFPRTLQGSFNLGNFKMTDVFDAFLREMATQIARVDIEETVFKYAPPKPIRSKKKRLRKKWAKKYEASILRKSIYRDCEITGVSP